MSVTVNGTNGLTFADGSTQATGFVPGMRNRIINGDMRIDQRNAGSSVTAGSAYTLDRWNVDRVWSGSTVTIQQSSTSPTGFTNSLVATVTTGAASASSSYFSIQQYIEGYNLSDMSFGTSSAKSFTVSFWVRSSVTGAFGIGCRNSTYDLSYWTTYTINSANTWEYKTITITAPTSGTWYVNNSNGLNLIFSLGCGTTYKVGTNNSWVAGNLIGAIGETDLIATTGATFYITGVQLEKGSVATPFEYRQYGQELALCQRYYEKSYNIDVVPGTSTYTGLVTFDVPAGYGRCGTSFAVPKRTSPTMTMYSRTGSSGNFTKDDTTNTPGTISGGTSRLSGNATSSQAAAFIILYHWVAEVEF